MVTLATIICYALVTPTTHTWLTERQEPVYEFLSTNSLQSHRTALAPLSFPARGRHLLYGLDIGVLLLLLALLLLSTVRGVAQIRLEIVVLLVPG
jgi:hypothetical protein